MLLRTIVAHEVLDLLAAEAPEDPEKVQVALEIKTSESSSFQARIEDFKVAHFWLLAVMGISADFGEV
jgi:hypothetical protein